MTRKEFNELCRTHGIGFAMNVAMSEAKAATPGCVIVLMCAALMVFCGIFGLIVLSHTYGPVACDPRSALPWLACQ